MSLFVVTGGAGFIGSHLVDSLLADGHSVRVLDDLSTGKAANLAQGAVLEQADIADTAALDRVFAGADGCFHLAAIASVQRANEAWAETHRVNQGGTVAVLDAARRAGRVKLVYASSAAVYGDAGAAPARETQPCAPMTAYGADKLGCEHHAAVGWRVHGVPNFGLRPFNVYGPRQDPHSPYSGVISIFAARAQAGQELVLHGDGGQTRDFLHVHDAVAHFRAAFDLLGRRAGAYVANACTGRPTTILALADMLAALTGTSPRIVHGPGRAGDIRHSLGDPSYAIETLGVTARTELRDGLAALLA
jgi:UDP-glucose 4-epimerase